MKMGRWLWIMLGLLLAAPGAILKALDMMKPEAVISWHFFSGAAYVLMIVGVVLVVVGLGHDVLFSGEEHS